MTQVPVYLAHEAHDALPDQGLVVAKRGVGLSLWLASALVSVLWARLGLYLLRSIW